MPSRDDLVRAAAFIDGEGCICIKRHWPDRKGGRASRQILELSVVNTDIRLPMWFASTFGGTVCTFKRPRVNHLFCWRVTNCRAEQVLKDCFEFFLIKREQAEIALQFRKLIRPRGSNIPQSELDQREEFKQRLTLIKKTPRQSVGA